MIAATKPKKNYHYFLFDWDGCLADTLSAWMATYLEVYNSYGVKATPAEVVAKSWGNLELGPLNFGISDHRKVWDEIVEKVGLKLQQVQLFPGAVELLQNIKNKGGKTAIVTSSRRKLVEPAIKFNHLEKLIDVVVTEQDVSKPKPDPEMVELALTKLEGKKDKAVVIGDTNKDVLAGKAAGIATILILHQANKAYYDFDKLKMSKPDIIVVSFAELNF